MPNVYRIVEELFDRHEAGVFAWRGREPIFMGWRGSTFQKIVLAICMERQTLDYRGTQRPLRKMVWHEAPEIEDDSLALLTTGKLIDQLRHSDNSWVLGLSPSVNNFGRPLPLILHHHGDSVLCTGLASNLASKMATDALKQRLEDPTNTLCPRRMAMELLETMLDECKEQNNPSLFSSAMNRLLQEALHACQHDSDGR